jgi:hypothetical protein
VRGLERRHQNFIIDPEALIVLTSVLSEFDPRLRDEAIDWCVHFHRYISPVRLQNLAKMYEPFIKIPFSIFSMTFNSIADVKTKWAILTSASPLKLQIQGKSILRGFETPSMLNFRIRSLIGVGAKADVLAFLFITTHEDFIASDLLETGYSKRRIAAILNDFTEAGILSEAKVRNQLRYTFTKQDQMAKLLGEMPKKLVNWQSLLSILLPLHACFKDAETAAIGVRAIDIRNLLNQLSDQLTQLKLKPPPLEMDLEKYWKNVTDWMLEITFKLAEGKYPK